MICDGCTHEENCPAKAEYGGAKRCSAFKPQEMTNEEWLKQANTEHLAWMISLFVGNAIAKHDCGNDEDIKPIKWVEWLKQPHTFE